MICEASDDANDDAKEDATDARDDAKEASRHSNKASRKNQRVQDFLSKRCQSDETKELEKGCQSDETKEVEAAHFWSNLSSSSESEETTSVEPGFIWVDERKERLHQAEILIRSAQLHQAEAQNAVVRMANAGTKKGKQRLVSDFFTPEKTCGPPIDDNILWATRGSRGRPHPATLRTAHEFERWLKNKQVQDDHHKLLSLEKLENEKKRADENLAKQILVPAVEMAVGLVAPIIPEVATLVPQQTKPARGPGRPCLTEEEKEHRRMFKKIQGKDKKVPPNCRIHACPPSAGVRKKLVGMVDDMAISLHDPLGSSLPKGRWNSQVPPNNPW